MQRIVLVSVSSVDGAPIVKTSADVYVTIDAFTVRPSIHITTAAPPLLNATIFTHDAPVTARVAVLTVVTVPSSPMFNITQRIVVPSYRTART
jgi:hypothetical protein